MDSLTPETQLGLKLARWSGLLLGVFFLGYGPWTAWEAGTAAGWPHVLRAAYIVVFGMVLLLPIHRAPSRGWWWAGFTALGVLAAGFVFVMIVTVMFDYMAAAERDERLGVPGFEGTLVFFSLMQVPIMLFLRKPELLE